MKSAKSAYTSHRWVERNCGIRILGIACTAGVFAAVATGWLLIKMLIPNLTVTTQIALILFLLGAISGSLSIAVSYRAEEQQRMPIIRSGLKYDHRSGRMVAAALLIAACVALASAFAMSELLPAYLTIK